MSIIDRVRNARDNYAMNARLRAGARMTAAESRLREAKLAKEVAQQRHDTINEYRTVRAETRELNKPHYLKVAEQGASRIGSGVIGALKNASKKGASKAKTGKVKHLTAQRVASGSPFDNNVTQSNIFNNGGKSSSPFAPENQRKK